MSDQAQKALDELLRPLSKRELERDQVPSLEALQEALRKSNEARRKALADRLAGRK